jgi:hypothetical protein
MQTKRSTWLNWFQALHSRDLEEPTAVLLEAAGPLSILLGQLVIVGQPFLKGLLPTGQWEDLVHMLVSPEENREFTSLLCDEELER